MNLNYLIPGMEKPVQANTGNADSHLWVDWVHHMVEANPDTNFFYTTETTDIWEDSMNYKELLRKYIDHVGEREGVTFLRDFDRSKSPWAIKFTDDEWAALQQLDN